MAWQYKRTETQFEQIPEGRYRAIIDSAEKAVSKTSGNDMLVIKMIVSGQSSSLWYYISFLDDRPEVTNRMLTQLFDSFGIEDGNFNLESYRGHVGGINVVHDDQGRARINYLLNKKQQEQLPPFVGEAPKPLPQADEDGFMHAVGEAGEDDIPF